MAFKFVILSCVLAMVHDQIHAGVIAPFAQPLVAAAPIAARLEEFDVVPQYNYGYNVADALTGDYKSQTERRNGDLVQGQYTVADPDGTLRVVDYTADSVNGFNAIVRKEPLIAAAPAVVAEPAIVPARVAAAPARIIAAVPAPIVAPRYTAAYAAAPVARYAAYTSPLSRLSPFTYAAAAPIVAV